MEGGLLAVAPVVLTLANLVCAEVGDWNLST